MKNFFLNSFGLKKDKKKKDADAEDGTDSATPQETPKAKDKDSKHKRSSASATGGAADNTTASTSSNTHAVTPAPTATDGKGKSSSTSNGDNGAATPGSAAKKKSSSSSSAAVHPLPPPPPPQNRSPVVQSNPTQLELHHTALDDSDDSAQHAADIFPAEQTEVSLVQIAEVFQVFRPFVDNCASAAIKQSSLSKLRKILPAIAAVDTHVTAETIEEQGFHPSFAIAPLLNHLLAQPAALRARLCIAIYRFCGEMIEEVEDEMLSSETGLFSGLQAFNPNLSNNNNVDGTSFGSGANMTTLARSPNIDLAKIYHNLLHKEDYLPTAEELNEICLRVQDLLRLEPNVLLIGMPAVLVGDLHGQIRDLLENVLPRGGPLVPASVLATAAAATAKSPLKKAKANAAAADKAKPKSSSASPSASAKSGSASPANPVAGSNDEAANYLFLGDYVDRGSNSLRIIAVLFTAKVLSPNTVFLLRGNHECANTNRFYGFLDECHRRYPIVNGKVTSLQLCTLSPSEEDVEDGEGSGGASSGSGTSSNNNGGSAAAEAAKSSSTSEPTAQELLEQVNAACAGEGTADDMGWDMKDHPLWLVANDAFKMLPLCAALYEEVEEAAAVEEGAAAEATSATDTATVTSTAEGKPAAKKAKKATPTDSSVVSTDASPKSPKTPKTGARKGGSGAAAATTLTNTSRKGGLSRANSSFAGSAAPELPTPQSPTPNASFAKPKKTRKVVRVCAMHGGLSPSVDDSFDGIIAINRFRAIERGALADLTWSDPASESVRPGSAGGNGVRAPASATPKAMYTSSDSPVLDDEVAEANASPSVPNSKQVPLSTFQAPCVFRGTAAGFTGNPRGTGHIFGEDITMDFINTNHLYFVVRAHQCVHEGFQWTHHDRLLTVFSAPNYCGMRNKGAVLLLDAKGAPTLEQYEYTDDSDNPLMCTASVPQPPKMFS